MIGSQLAKLLHGKVRTKAHIPCRIALATRCPEGLVVCSAIRRAPARCTADKKKAGIQSMDQVIPKVATSLWRELTPSGEASHGDCKAYSSVSGIVVRRQPVIGVGRFGVAPILIRIQAP
mmetsp:Transcript_48776/g.77715  ORF Transcript_48776/g.77715 Transcript_48776/m.77715 type:complete len:120 (-) Transcript_48776:309-668(-)